MRKLSTTLLVILSAAFSGCASITRPDVDICLVNAPGKKLNCYNMKTDYNDDGTLVPGAQFHTRPASDLSALNKHITFTSNSGPEDAIAKLKAYIKNLREAYEDGCN